MLSKSKNLHFPDFKYLGDVQFKKKKDYVKIYSLSWEKSENCIRRSHENWRKQSCPDIDIPFVPCLPNEYENWCNNLEFAITQDYMREIKRMSNMALTEWNIKRSFDTNVKETCLDPAISFVWCAFYLIADCIYDSEKNYYDRTGRSEIAKYILSFRFWIQQTGRGIVSTHAGLNKLKRYIKDDDESDYIKEGKKWLKIAEKHVERLNDAMKLMHKNQKSGNIKVKNLVKKRDKRNE